MSRCQAKIEKTVPGALWWTKKSSEDCKEEAKSIGKYCQEHGCVYCSYQAEGEKISAVDGISLVCISHQNEDFERTIENKKELKKLEKEAERTRVLLQGLNKKFLEDISEILDKLKTGKRNIISKNFERTVVIKEELINNFFFKTIDEAQPLSSEEIKSWKDNYQGKGGDLDQINSSEKEFLLRLAKEKRNKEEKKKQTERREENENYPRNRKRAWWLSAIRHYRNR